MCASLHVDGQLSLESVSVLVEMSQVVAPRAHTKSSGKEIIQMCVCRCPLVERLRAGDAFDCAHINNWVFAGA